MVANWATVPPSRGPASAWRSRTATPPNGATTWRVSRGPAPSWLVRQLRGFLFTEIDISWFWRNRRAASPTAFPAMDSARNRPARPHQKTKIFCILQKCFCKSLVMHTSRAHEAHGRNQPTKTPLRRSTTMAQTAGEQWLSSSTARGVGRSGRSKARRCRRPSKARGVTGRCVVRGCVFDPPSVTSGGNADRCLHDEDRAFGDERLGGL